MEFKRLGELLDIQAGKRVSAKEYQKNFRDDLFPFLNCSVKPTGFYKHYNTDENSIISFTTASAGQIYWVKEKFWANDSCIRFFKKSNLLNYRFAYYFLKFQEPNLTNSKHGSIISKLSINVFKNWLIPLPPLNQQQKIVNFLDKWNTLIDKLETEQLKRTEQLKFYLNRTFQNLKSNKTPFLNLVEVRRGEQVNKENLSSLQERHLYPVYNGGILPSGYYEKFNLTKDKITICSGGAAGDVKFIDVDFWAGGECLYIVQKSNLVDYKFVYFFLKHNQDKLINAARGGTIKHLDKNIFKVLQIPLIELKEQQRISMSLYKINYLTFKDLPKEIELRKQQYQYYLNAIFQHLI